MMGKTTIGKLKEMLVIETQIDAETSIVVIPKGSIIEVSSEDDYPHTTSTMDIKEAVKYLKEVK